MPSLWSRLAWAGALAAQVLATSCGGDGGPSAGGTRTPVVHAATVDDGFFYPKDLTIVAGDSVTWTWNNNNDHSVTSGTTPDPSEDPRLFDSGVRNSGSFGYRFVRSGTFSYFCRKHWNMGMTGTVIVEAP